MRAIGAIMVVALSGCAGTGVRPLAPASKQATYEAVAMIGPTTVAVTSAGAIVTNTTWDSDSDWAEIDIDVGGALRDIWGLETGRMNTGPTGNPWNARRDAIAVGARGVVVRAFLDPGEYGRWGAQKLDSGTDADLHGIDGPQMDALVIVGARGTVLGFDGETFRPMSTDTKATLYDVHGQGLAVGERGTILERRGGSWHTVPSPTSSDLYAVAAGVAVGAGGTIVEKTADGWRSVASPTTADLRDVALLESGAAIAVGDGGTVLMRDQGGWRVHRSGLGADLRGLHIQLNDAATLVGSAGTLRRFGWSPWTGWETDAVAALWGASADDLFAAGRDGVSRFQGGSWTPVFDQYHLFAISGRGAEDAVVAGADGAVFRWDGTRWASLSAEFNEDIRWVRLDENGHVEVMNSAFTTWINSGGSWAHVERSIPEHHPRCEPARTVWLAHQGRALFDCGMQFHQGRWQKREDGPFLFTVRGQRVQLDAGGVSVDGQNQYRNILEALGIRCERSPRRSGIVLPPCPPRFELTGAWTDGQTLFIGGRYHRSARGFVLRLGARRLVPREER